MTCAQIASGLSVLGAVGVAVILTVGGATIHRRRLHFRSLRWRQLWWASWLSFLVGIALSTFFCGSPAGS